MLPKKIKVLVVDDSLLMREIISSGISKDKYIEVVATAPDVYIARDKIIELEPDVVTLDINMPKMDGIEFLKRLIPQYPLPVVVVSSQGENVIDALNAGAVEFIVKPNVKNPGGIDLFIKNLISKIKIASIARVDKYGCNKNANNMDKQSGCIREKSVIAIGASTGGTEATLRILKELKQDLPGILVVQHMPPVFTKMYADRLNAECDVEVKEAEDNDEVYPGRVLIAPGDYHMKLVKKNGKLRVCCFKGERVNSHCPSVDVLFNSLVDVGVKNSMGIILTGMGNDGAKGLLNMKKNGSYTVGQDENTSVVYGMPMVAKNIGAVCDQLPIDMIPRAIYKWFEEKIG